jgi:ABC-type uncharacterized transport system ATPase subunit
MRADPRSFFFQLLASFRRGTMDGAIVLSTVTKTFGQTTAVKNLDLAIPHGGLYGFIGPNGAVDD